MEKVEVLINEGATVAFRNVFGSIGGSILNVLVNLKLSKVLLFSNNTSS